MSKTTESNFHEFSSELISSPTSTLSTPTFSANQPKDEFASTQYLDPNARLPRIQALRGMTPDLCGYFLSVEEMAKSGWVDFDPVADQLVGLKRETKSNKGIILI